MVHCAVTLILFAFYLINGGCGQTTVERDNGNGFVPTWASLDARPLPEWYDEAKVGIFIHWGVYAVPGYGSEWFWQNWKGVHNVDYINYMEKNYKPGHTYQEFAKDFTAEFFDPDAWADLFEKSGAKYVVLTSKHHEGFTLWPSKYSFSWNAVDIGPHRDIIDELATAIRKKKSIKFGLYHSLYEWFNPLWIDDRDHKFATSNFVNMKVMPELFELVNKYRPEVLWSDGDWEAPDTYWRSREFLVWLFADSPVNATVVTNDRWGHDIMCKHGDFYTCSDRYNPGVLQTHKWENAMTLDKKSWGHRVKANIEDYMSTKELITELVSTVSCGGNLLVNVGPTKEGTIQPIFTERLLDMGRWLTTNGAAMYSSIPWLYQNDTYTPNVWYTTAKQLRPGYETIFAIVLDYPYETNSIKLYAMAGLFDNNTKITMLGYSGGPLKWSGTTTTDYLLVEFPPKHRIDKEKLLDIGWTLQIELHSTIKSPKIRQHRNYL